MNFSHTYYKLANKIFSTIRRKTGLSYGEIEPITLRQEFQFRARVLHISDVIITDLPEGFLLLDCLYPNSEIIDKKDCIKLIQSFYRNKIDFEHEAFKLIILLRLDSKITDFITK